MTQTGLGETDNSIVTQRAPKEAANAVDRSFGRGIVVLQPMALAVDARLESQDFEVEVVMGARIPSLGGELIPVSNQQTDPTEICMAKRLND
jgi:hypothetical protein